MEKAKSDKAKPINIAVGYYMYSLVSSKEQAVIYMDSVIKYSLNTNDEYFPLAAYRDKAYLLRQLYKYEEAIQNYVLAENLAKRINTDFYYKIRLDIGELKSEEFSEVEEALEIYRSCLKYYDKQKTIKNNYFYCYNQNLFDMADAHKALKNSDSTSFYNKKGYENCIKTKDDYYRYLFVLNEGANHVLKKNHAVAIDSINKALPKMIEFKNTINIIASYYYLGQANIGLGKDKKAVSNFKSLDSVFQIYKDIYPEFTNGYQYLINYYKKNGNTEMQLKYTNKLMHIDSLLVKRYKKFNKLINKKYEIPHIIESKENTIQDLKSKIIFGSLFFVIVIIGLFCYHKNQNQKYKKRFELIVNNNEFENKNITVSSNSNSIDSKNLSIADKIVNQILDNLNIFESELKFLNPNVTINILADEFETNTKYLSRIINEYKQKSFVQYINDLRINYALNSLQIDSKLRKYTMQALANEFGFNTAESFSNAFFKKAGIKPSFYIKELNNYQNK